MEVGEFGWEGPNEGVVLVVLVAADRRKDFEDPFRVYARCRLVTRGGTLVSGLLTLGDSPGVRFN